jgi:GntR family transcriptional regulator
MRGISWKGLDIVVSPVNRDPMYKQIMDQIKNGIARGVLAPDTALPSIREMAVALGLSPITIKRAYSDLEREGLIITRAGLGSFVAGVSRAALRDQKLKEVQRELERILSTARAFGISQTRIRKMVGEAWPR